jgi:hypothetical protein
VREGNAAELQFKTGFNVRIIIILIFIALWAGGVATDAPEAASGARVSTQPISPRRGEIFGRCC